MLERGSKVFSCFLDVRKAFGTVWIDGLLYKLFLELGIKGRMWLAIRGLYTNVKAQVFYKGSLSRKTGHDDNLESLEFSEFLNSKIPSSELSLFALYQKTITRNFSRV